MAAFLLTDAGLCTVSEKMQAVDYASPASGFSQIHILSADEYSLTGTHVPHLTTEPTGVPDHPVRLPCREFMRII